MRKRLILYFFIVMSLGIFAVDIDGNYSNFLYYGTGTKSGNEIILTNSGTANVGAMWSRHLFDLNQDFTANFEIYMGASDAGADGVAFFFKPEEYKNTYFAWSGGELGYGGSDAGRTIFQKTFGLKFDTHQNASEPADDHLAFIKEGNVTGFQQKTVSNIEDGQWHDASISWDASANTFTYNFDGTTDTYSGNITTFLGATTGYFGFTGATGSQSNAQKIRNVEVTATIPDSEYKLKIEENITSGATYSVGGLIEYEVIIKNLGTETISNLSLSNNTGVTYSNWTQGSSLAPGATITVNGEQRATQQDVINGSIVDTVTVEGTLPGGEQLNDAAEARAVVSLVEFLVAKSVSNVTKLANGGLQLEYTFEFANVGQETLTNLTVTDPKIPGGITMDKTTIPSGERAVGTANYTVTQEDINIGQIVNTATFSVKDSKNQSLSKQGTNTYDLPMLDDFIGSKAVLRGSNFTYVGETIEYEFLIENIGNRALSNLTATDPGISGSITLDKTSLLPGETSKGTGIHTVTQADLDAGSVVSTVKFTGTAPGGALIEKEDTITVSATLIDNFEGRKSVLRGNNFTAVGDEIGYSFEIENTGNRTLNNLTVTDPGISGGIIMDKTTILPGETARGTGIYTVTQADINAKEIITTATFTGTSPAGTSIQKQDSTRVKAALVEDFEAKKSIVRGNNFVSVGDEIEYSFEINNIGNTTLNNLVVTDPKIPGGITLDKTTVLPGEKASGTGIYRVTQADITAGEVINTAIFSAGTIQGSTLRKQASVSSSGVDFGVISTQVTSSPKEISYGGTLRYSIEVNNTGISDIKNLTVYDNISDIKNKKNEKIFTDIRTVSVRDSSGDVGYSGGITNSSSDLIISNLAAGETVTILLDAKIKDASQITLTGGEQIKNQVLVTGKNPVDDGPLYPTVPYSSLDTGQISITEDGNKIIEPNEKATYTITIENKGALRVENISITDKISEIVNLNGDHVFNRASTSDIKVIDGIGVSVPFTYDSAIEEIIVSEIKANDKVTVVINAVSKNIKFTEGEVITNKAIVNGVETISTLEAATGIVTDLSLKKEVITTGDDNIAELDDTITYTIEVANKNTRVALKDLVMEDSLQTVVNTKGELAFKNISISKIYNKDTSIERNDLYPNNYTGSLSIPIILPNEILVIEIQANLNRDADFVNNEVIDNIAKIDLLRNKNSGISASADNASGLQDGAPIVVIVPEIYIEKTAEKSKITMGEEVIYTIKVSNTSDTSAKNVKIEDAVSEIEGNTIKGLKESVFTNWKWETESTNFKNKLPGDNKDLKIENITLASKESVTFKLTAKTNPNIIDVFFENTATVTEGLTGKVKKSTFKINSANAEIIVTKSANKREARRGEFITYTVRVENPNDVPVKNIKIFDTPPAGFKYMKKSSRFFRTNEKSQEIKPASDKPLIYEELNGLGIDIGAREVFEITYMFKVGIGVKNGGAENKVVVKSSLNEVISNTGKVTVKIVDDPLFDAATIIGKVFNDRDGDGFQDTASAENVLISLDGYEFAATKIIDGISTTEKAKNNIVIESLGEGDEIILIFKPAGDLWETNVITKSGTNITLTESNQIFTDHSMKKKKGMTGEDISLSQKALKVEGQDYIAVTIVNNGREEKGIPGARLMTIDGLVIETDRYGRFHVPPVKKDRGNSYLIKLDINSLPMGSVITTENPKVKRLTRSMTKFNYGVDFPEQKSRLKEKEMIVNIGEVFFIKNKAEFSPGQEMNLEILAEKLKKYKKSSIIIQTDTNTKGLKSLELIRSDIIRNKLTELLGEDASDIEITIERGDKND